MPIHKLALILKNPQNQNQFLLLKQSHPPKFHDQEYDSYIDSDLYDLPSANLNPLQQQSGPHNVVEIQIADSHLVQDIDLKTFDFHSALNEMFEQMGFGEIERGVWKYCKYVKEPEFGPDLPIQTIFITGELAAEGNDLPDICEWMSVQSCLNLLLEVKPSSKRVGPLAVVGLINESLGSAKWKVPPTITYQEYPPGVTLIPMTSRTAKPFHTTNLVVFAPEYVPSDSGDKSFIACGDALIVDPGCLSQFHEELLKVVTTLPRRLVVFVTHHHHDHVDGLSVIQKCNPNAALLAHENTMRRISKDDWSLGYTSVSGDEEINIGVQTLKVIFAPGHTDGHVALLHVNTHSLIVGDHCVGQGSAVLDITSGGDMTEYFKTTYNFLELSPHSLIPMHGRPNLWPKHMLCSYLKNRRSREANILAAIEGGARTLFDIVSTVYSDVDRRAWFAASSNVRLHVDHLAQQHKLPKDFSVQKFTTTCGLHFGTRWILAYVRCAFHEKKPSFLITGAVAVAAAVAGFAVFYSVKKETSQVVSE